MLLNLSPDSQKKQSWFCKDVCYDDSSELREKVRDCRIQIGTVGYKYLII